eukprot:655712-Rhodomonas_salina.1
MIATLRPASAAVNAAVRPVGPPPSTTRSQSLLSSSWIIARLVRLLRLLRGERERDETLDERRGLVAGMGLRGTLKEREEEGRKADVTDMHTKPASASTKRFAV